MSPVKLKWVKDEIKKMKKTALDLYNKAYELEMALAVEND